jgi:hypothetical protein
VRHQERFRRVDVDEPQLRRLDGAKLRVKRRRQQTECDQRERGKAPHAALAIGSQRGGMLPQFDLAGPFRDP